jgi:hypothetical protein
VPGHVRVGGRGLGVGDRLAGGSELSVEGLDLGSDVLLGVVGGGNLFSGRGRRSLGEGGLGQGGRKRNAAQRGDERAPSELPPLAWPHGLNLELFCHIRNGR